MKYNPEIHHRKSIRLKEYDYSINGAYFITICTKDKKCLFGDIIDEEIQLNACGQIILKCWYELQNHYKNIELDLFVVMPNHVHGIIFIFPPNINVGAALVAAQPSTDTQNSRGNPCGYPNGRAGARPAPTVTQNDGAGVKPAPTVGEIIGTFKSLATHYWLKHIKENKLNLVGKFWQRNYYEHIIRDEDKLDKIREYIHYNHLKWHLDRENPDRIGKDILEEDIFVRRGNNRGYPEL